MQVWMGLYMRDKVELTGIVLSSTLFGDYDKRLVILTKERGKITAFAKGARKPNSPYLGISEPFNFGTFTLMESYDAYRLLGADIKEYFLDVKNDIEAICYGTYFCDILEYLCVEGIGDTNVMNLIYVTLKVLQEKRIPMPLVRRIFELKMLALDGEAMVAFSCACCDKKGLAAFSLRQNGLVCEACGRLQADSVKLSESAVYTIQYILSSPIKQLYHFQITGEVQKELDAVIGSYFDQHIPKKFKSLEILTSLS